MTREARRRERRLSHRSLHWHQVLLEPGHSFMSPSPGYLGTSSCPWIGHHQCQSSAHQWLIELHVCHHVWQHRQGAFWSSYGHLVCGLGCSSSGHEMCCALWADPFWQSWLPQQELSQTLTDPHVGQKLRMCSCWLDLLQKCKDDMNTERNHLDISFVCKSHSKKIEMIGSFIKNATEKKQFKSTQVVFAPSPPHQGALPQQSLFTRCLWCQSTVALKVCWEDHFLIRWNCKHQFCMDSAQFLCQSHLWPKNHLVHELDKCNFHVKETAPLQMFLCVIGTFQDVSESFKKFFHPTCGSWDIEESSCYGDQDCEFGTILQLSVAVCAILNSLACLKSQGIWKPNMCSGAVLHNLSLKTLSLQCQSSQRVIAFVWRQMFELKARWKFSLLLNFNSRRLGKVSGTFFLQLVQIDCFPIHLGSFASHLTCTFCLNIQWRQKLLTKICVSFHALSAQASAASLCKPENLFCMALKQVPTQTGSNISNVWLNCHSHKCKIWVSQFSAFTKWIAMSFEKPLINHGQLVFACVCHNLILLPLWLSPPSLVGKLCFQPSSQCGVC